MKIRKVVSLVLVLVLVLALLASCSKSSEITDRMHAPMVAATMAPKTNGMYTLTNAGMPVAEMSSGMNTEEYKGITENRFMKSVQSPLSTFSIDVDTASFSNTRRFIEDGMKPPVDAVRIEELINYFTYDLKEPDDGAPFSVTTELAVCPWNTENYLAMVALQGEKIEKEKMPLSNLVFLFDVSGSMSSHDKLPLIKSSFQLLVEQLGENDRVSIVVYAGASGLVLDSARGDEKDRILDAINSLEAGGSTAGGAGIELAYKTAAKNYIPGGNNRVILATDGDFNVGVSSESGLMKLIEEKREEGVFLSVLGFGTGNIKDNKMETLADKGNGNYAYIDCLAEARKVLVSEMGGTLLTIAKDVKIQIEFNPSQVREYRLIGYENRVLRNEDFEDDSVDAGEIGAGHSVVAFYEVVPYKEGEEREESQLKYQNPEIKEEWADEWMEVRLRYKLPYGSDSSLLLQAVREDDIAKAPSDNFLFAAAVAQFGMLLRDSEHKGMASWDSVTELAKASLGDDAEGYRNAFIELIRKAKRLYG